MRRVRTALASHAKDLRAEGRAIPEIAGKLLRPLVAWSLVPSDIREELDEGFWSGALAIQMVHEASLLHDDVLDHATLRRGRETVAARDGVGAAVVGGDRILTSAYTVADVAALPSFLGGFIRAVEATVAGEVAQGRARGRFLSDSEYEDVIRRKSGELFASAVHLAAICGGVDLAPEIGLRIGSLYQRVDDLLDYCAAIEQDKPALQDWRQRKWTFPLGIAGIDTWELSEEEVVVRLRSGAPAPLLECVADLEATAEALIRDVALVTDPTPLDEILRMWCAAARNGVEGELAATWPALRQVS
jgi:geranylgeranyl pyrophosphate synthase